MSEGEKQKACAHCGEQAEMTCTGCKVTVYCSRNHQKEDWKLHKQLCKHLANFQDRPSPAHRRAIVLPESGKKPHFVWVRSLEKEQQADLEDEKQGFARVDFGEDVFGGGDVHIQISLLLLNDYTSDLGKNLDHAVYMGIGSMSQTDGSQPNECIRSNCCDPLVARRFRGPVVIFGLATMIQERRPVDISAVDFSLVIKRLQEYHYEKIYPDGLLPRETTGVMVLNPKVAAAHNASPFGEVYVPLWEHPIWASGEKSELSTRIRMPLITLEWKIDEDENSDGDDDEWETSPAAFLHVNYHTSANLTTDPDFGAIPQEWLKAKGSILVVRQDEKALSAAMVEALCKYSAQETQRLLLKATEDQYGRRDAITGISKKSWEHFWEQYKKAEGIEEA